MKKPRKPTTSKKSQSDAAAPVLRCDRLPVHANRDKTDAVHALMRDWRKAATVVASDQWRRFFQVGRFDAIADVAGNHRKESTKVRSVLVRQISEHGGFCRLPLEGRRLARMAPGFIDPFAAMKASLGAAQTQMVRRQVVGMLESFISNRQNDFVRIVHGSSLDETTRHMLFAVNRARAWFTLDRPIKIRSVEGGKHDTLVPIYVRRLARRIMSHVLNMHDRPSMRRIAMTVDQRIANLEPADEASHFPYWLKLTVGRGKRIHLPLSATPPFLKRIGTRSLSFNIQSDRETHRLTVGVTTDIGEACAAQRETYAASASNEALRLDFGLATLFVSDRGDLIGRNFLDKLRRLDATLTGITRHVMRSGGKPRQSKRYRQQMTRLRGFIVTEINRALAHMVKLRRPQTMILERLDFRSPALSKRMNRILTNCGRAAVRAKLTALEQELGVTAALEPCAYTSQTCSGCGYTDKRNRTGQDRFECLWCGKKMHADANAANNLGSERFRAPDGLFGRAARKAVLAGLVTGHGERWRMERRKPLHARKRGSGTPPDPRRTNPYFRDWIDAARSGHAGIRETG